MKTRNLNVITIACFFMLFIATLSAQKEVYWIGGAIGQESEWNCPRNWSTQNVPDEFSDVFIENTSSTTFTYPSIKSEDVSINSLYMDSGAVLTISENSSLKVHTYVTSVNDHNFDGLGSLIILNEHLDAGKELIRGIAVNYRQQAIQPSLIAGKN